MKVDQALTRLAAQFGIISTYKDLGGTEQPTSRETNLALLRANGLGLETEVEIKQAVRRYDDEAKKRFVPEEIICAPGDTLSLPLPRQMAWSLELEGNHQAWLHGRAAEMLKLAALPLGLHMLTVGSGGSAQQVRLICAPRTASSLASLANEKRIWGINAALYGLSSDSLAGIGNYQMLGESGRLFARQGADFVGINPVHAIGWHSPEVTSPYSPTHRGFLNSLHIAVERVVPQSDQTARLIAAWKHAKGPAQSDGKVNYAWHSQQQAPILTALFNDFRTLATSDQRAQFESFCVEGGAALRRFARFEYLSGEQGTDWRSWPETGAEGDASALIISSDRDLPLLFHAWLQWIAHQQLQQAHADCRTGGMKLGLYLDLAVGARRDGAESWCESQAIADGVSIGAPPDHLSPGGQNWNLAALAPKKLAADNYQTFRNILRKAVRYCGIIRIDHVLGLNRIYWIPDDGSPGGYVKQNFNALLALVRLESHKSNTVVVGEDLGLVPGGFRKTMNKQNIYSYGVLQYEKNKQGHIKAASKLRKKSLVCFGTHDTPTLAGYLQGKDIEWWLKLGWIDSIKAEEMQVQRREDLRQILALAGKKPNKEPLAFDVLQRAAYNVLAGSDTAMVSVQLDDVFATAEAQNLPGTIDEHPNWQRLYPCSVEQFGADSRLAAMGQIMRSSGRGSSAPMEKTT